MGLEVPCTASRKMEYEAPGTVLVVVLAATEGGKERAEEVHKDRTQERLEPVVT